MAYFRLFSYWCVKIVRNEIVENSGSNCSFFNKLSRHGYGKFWFYSSRDNVFLNSGR